MRAQLRTKSKTMSWIGPKLRLWSIVSLILVTSWKANLTANKPEHSQTPQYESFLKYKGHIESGGIPTYLGQSERERLKELLGYLKIPESSQLLVFSTTSLQLSKITPAKPRAIYFNDNLYLGYVPGGKIEVLEVDQKEGILPYIFSLPQSSSISHPKILQSDRCMRCHDSDKTGFTPGLLLESVVPQQGGGTLDRLFTNSAGHQIPYVRRFGGWYLTGINQHPGSWANSLGKFDDGKILRVKTSPNPLNLKRYYPHPRSEAIAHAVLSHQIGFTNLCIRLGFLHESHDQKILEQELENLTSYTLFQEEAPLPNPFRRDTPFTSEFEDSFIDSPSEYNLKKLNLKSRLLEHRCSYMLKSKIFKTLPSEVRKTFFTRLRKAILDPLARLKGERVNLESEERNRIHHALSFHFPLYREIKKAP